MFAFSENSWKGRVEFYLKKGISKLKENDWKHIMKVVAEYSSFVMKPKLTVHAWKASEPTKEDLEMEWESASDSGSGADRD